MNNIDFLPDGYRQQHTRQNVRVLRVVVVVSFLSMLVLASFVQYGRLRLAKYYLAEIETQYTAAQQQNTQLARLQSKLKIAESDAELLTYLRHPWPRTQVLAALLAPLPDTVTLNQLEISVDSKFRYGLKNKLRRNENNDEATGTQLPAEQDLNLLRELLDQATVSAVLSGTTTNPAALHAYLGKLNRTSLFQKADLDSLESIPSTNGDMPEGVMSFTATVVILPGYGQPGGPVGSLRIARSLAAPAEGGDTP